MRRSINLGRRFDAVGQGGTNDDTVRPIPSDDIPRTGLTYGPVPRATSCDNATCRPTHTSRINPPSGSRRAFVGAIMQEAYTMGEREKSMNKLFVAGHQRDAKTLGVERTMKCAWPKHPAYNAYLYRAVMSLMISFLAPGYYPTHKRCPYPNFFVTVHRVRLHSALEWASDALGGRGSWTP